MNSSELYIKLGLKDLPDDKARLDVLSKWYLMKVSSEASVAASPDKQYEDYLESVGDFLDGFLSAVNPVDLAQSITDFDGRNAVQMAALLGLDRYLAGLSIPRDILNAKDKYGMSPIHLAAMAGHMPTVKLLLELGADVKAFNNNKQSPLFTALILPLLATPDEKEKRLACYDYLKTKAPITILRAKDKNDDTLLQQMAEHGLLPQLNDLLRECPELAGVSNNHSHYPVHTAILNHQLDCVIRLLQEPNAQQWVDSAGNTALHYAVMYGDALMIEHCCAAFKDKSNVLNLRKETPLMLAAKDGRIDVLEMLIQGKANIHAKDDLGYTFLSLAVLENQTDTVGWILTHTQVTEQEREDAKSLCSGLLVGEAMHRLFEQHGLRPSCH